MIYLDLFIGFLKVGLFSFGGAYGAISIIRDVVLSYGWLDDEAIAYMIAVSESTPGPIMINLATYVGSSQAGLPGAVTATFAVVLPAFLIILLVMGVFQRALEHRYVKAFMEGVKSCVIGIILATGGYMTISNCVGDAKEVSVDGRTVILTIALGVFYFGIRRVKKRGISPIALILLSGCLGIVVYAFA